MMCDMNRTVVTIEIPVEHRFAVGDVISRSEFDGARSVWRVVEVGCTQPGIVSGVPVWDGAWYRLEPANDIAQFMAMEAHGRVAQASTPLVELMGPVTEWVRTVDRMCEPHVQ